MDNNRRVYIGWWHRHDPFPSRTALYDFDTLERIASDEYWDDNEAKKYAIERGWEVVGAPTWEDLIGIENRRNQK